MIDCSQSTKMLKNVSPLEKIAKTFTLIFGTFRSQYAIGATKPFVSEFSIEFTKKELSH